MPQSKSDIATIVLQTDKGSIEIDLKKVEGQVKHLTTYQIKDGGEVIKYDVKEEDIIKLLENLIAARFNKEPKLVVREIEFKPEKKYYPDYYPKPVSYPKYEPKPEPVPFPSVDMDKLDVYIQKKVLEVIERVDFQDIVDHFSEVMLSAINRIIFDLDLKKINIITKDIEVLHPIEKELDPLDYVKIEEKIIPTDKIVWRIKKRPVSLPEGAVLGELEE